MGKPIDHTASPGGIAACLISSFLVLETVVFTLRSYFPVRKPEAGKLESLSTKINTSLENYIFKFLSTHIRLCYACQRVGFCVRIFIAVVTSGNKWLRAVLSVRH